MKQHQTGRFRLSFVDEGRKPVNKPDPNYPDGMDFDISAGAEHTCLVKLPYPVPNCGKHVVNCTICGYIGIVTAAGRPDDPRSVRVACKGLVRA